LGHSCGRAGGGGSREGRGCGPGHGPLAGRAPAASQAAHCPRTLFAARQPLTAATAASSHGACCATAVGGSASARAARLPSACRPQGRSLSLSAMAAATANCRQAGNTCCAAASTTGSFAALLLSIWQKVARDATAGRRTASTASRLAAVNAARSCAGPTAVGRMVLELQPSKQLAVSTPACCPQASHSALYACLPSGSAQSAGAPASAPAAFAAAARTGEASSAASALQHQASSCCCSVAGRPARTAGESAPMMA